MKILLHICCAPCAIKVFEDLIHKGHEVAGFWYNPSIHPYGEFIKRRDSLGKLAELKKYNIIYNNHYNLTENLTMLMKNPEFQKRCLLCYKDRLEATAKQAEESCFDAFTTTLLYSKYQMHDSIRKIGEQIASKHDVEFYYQDFRPLWGRGITASKKLELYRQRWCGCIFSEYEAEKQRENRNKNKRHIK